MKRKKGWKSCKNGQRLMKWRGNEGRNMMGDEELDCMKDQTAMDGVATPAGVRSRCRSMHGGNGWTGEVVRWV